jgi:hypothetical protein
MHGALARASSGTTNLNVLVVGNDDVVEEALRTLRRRCRKPLVTCAAADPLVLPPSFTVGTLVLRDVGALSADGQRRLLAWLDCAFGGTQIIATSAHTLWPSFIQTGAFLETLYYRLNVVYVDLTHQRHADTDMDPAQSTHLQEGFGLEGRGPFVGACHPASTMGESADT